MTISGQRRGEELALFWDMAISCGFATKDDLEAWTRDVGHHERDGTLGEIDSLGSPCRPADRGVVFAMWCTFLRGVWRECAQHTRNAAHDATRVRQALGL